MENEKIVTYQDLENIYVLCMREVIKGATEHAWGETDLGAYGTFKKYDEANTEAVNVEREAKGEKKIVAITVNNKPFDRFDFQAINNTFAHLEPVYNEIYAFYNLTPQNAANCTMVSKQLVDLRNKLAHPDPNRPAEKVIEWQKNSVNYMNVIFGLGFYNIADKNGSVFYEKFQKLYVEYLSQQLEKWYYLDDFFDIEPHMIGAFLEACAVNGIKTTMRDGKYLFCTSNLEKTIAILKNSLAGGKVKEKKAKNKWAYVIPAAVALLLVLAVGLGSLLSSLGSSGQDNGGAANNEGQVEQTEQGNSSNQQNEAPESSEQNKVETNTAPPASATTNQIPEHLENAVTSLKHADRLSLSNKTLYVGVGEYITPSAAAMWGNVGEIYIYSEDTSIALGEPPLIKGVSKGTTFVVVESSIGGNSAYCVVVE